MRPAVIVTVMMMMISVTGRFGAIDDIKMEEDGGPEKGESSNVRHCHY
jgi:hypothetical protein